MGVDYTHPIIYTDLEGDSFEAQPPHLHFSTIESCEVVAAAIDEFGSIGHGTLRISGLVIGGILEREVQVHDGEEHIMHYVSFPHTRLALHSDYLLDEAGPNQVAPGTSVECLRMSMLQEGPRDVLVSLVLRRLPPPSDYYERIGTMRILGVKGSVDSRGGIYDAAAQRTLAIV